MIKIRVLISFLLLGGAVFAQPLVTGIATSKNEAAIARIDSATLNLRNKLYTFVDPGELNIYGFEQGDIPVYSDSLIALRLSLLETEIPLEYNDHVKNYINLYANRRRGLISKVLTTSQFYFPIFEEVFDRENIPLEFKYLAVIESALNQKAISPVGAAGLWQFMPATGRIYGLKTDNYFDGRKDIIKSTEAAVKYFKNSYALYKDWLLVIASYNCGPGNVNKAIKRAGGKRGIWDIMPYLPKETRGYVPAFIAATYVMSYASEHNIYPAPNQMYLHLDTVIVDNHISIQKLALAIQSTPEEIRQLNPSLKKGVIPFNPNGIVLTLPYQQAMRVAALRADTSFQSKVNGEWLAINNGKNKSSINSGKVIYKVQSGDNLAKIARKHDVSVAELKQWNKKVIKGSKVIKGQRLNIYPNRA